MRHRRILGHDLGHGYRDRAFVARRRGEPVVDAPPAAESGDPAIEGGTTFAGNSNLADVLRDEGEAYASRLRAAGVAITTVRYDGITHDFMMLNPLSETRATRAAVAQAIATLRQALYTA
jgi:hypothetical protein